MPPEEVQDPVQTAEGTPDTGNAASDEYDPEITVETLQAQLQAVEAERLALAAWRELVAENLQTAGLNADVQGNVFLQDESTARTVFGQILQAPPAPPQSSAASGGQSATPPAAPATSEGEPPSPWDGEAYRAYMQQQQRAEITEALKPIQQQNEMMLSLLTNWQMSSLLDQHAKPWLERMGVGHLLGTQEFQQRFQQAVQAAPPQARFDPNVITTMAAGIVPSVLKEIEQTQQRQQQRPLANLGAALRGGIPGNRTPSGSSAADTGPEPSADERSIAELTGMSVAELRAHREGRAEEYYAARRNGNRR